jgi:phosphoribosylanthranilate isomerase
MRVKICCISSIGEAETALACGADALGLVSSMPSGPGVIPETLIAEIADAVSDRARSVLLTSQTVPGAIADQYVRCRVNAIQLCEWISRESRFELRSLLPDPFIMQVVHVTGQEALPKARNAQNHVDAILLDSGTLTGDKRELGGTGRTHDWDVSRQIRDEVDVPVFLAGGLQASNVVAAVESVDPEWLDVCSGVRTDGNLDVLKLQAFMSELRRYSAAPRPS